MLVDVNNLSDADLRRSFLFLSTSAPTEEAILRTRPFLDRGDFVTRVNADLASRGVGTRCNVGVRTTEYFVIKDPDHDESHRTLVLPVPPVLLVVPPVLPMLPVLPAPNLLPVLPGSVAVAYPIPSIESPMPHARPHVRIEKTVWTAGHAQYHFPDVHLIDYHLPIVHCIASPISIVEPRITVAPQSATPWPARHFIDTDISAQIASAPTCDVPTWHSHTFLDEVAAHTNDVWTGTLDDFAEDGYISIDDLDLDVTCCDAHDGAHPRSAQILSPLRTGASERSVV